MSTTNSRMTVAGRGRFITFEGPEGSGKSTQLRLLGERLRKAGQDVLETAGAGRHAHRHPDPARAAGCEESRAVPHRRTAADVRQPRAECGPVDSARSSAGRTVLSDRFTDSTLVYQGVGRGLGAEVVYELDRIACRGLVPDLTLVIDIDAETGLARARRRSVRTEDSETRMEEQDVGFHRRVRDAYRQLAADEPARVQADRREPDAGSSGRAGVAGSSGLAIAPA